MSGLDLILAVFLLLALLGSWVLYRQNEHLLGEFARSRQDLLRQQVVASTAVRRTDELAGSLEVAEHERDQVTEELAAARAMVPVEHYTAEELIALRESTCRHCGGVHAIACPRVKRMRFRPDGNPVEVEFWPDGEWPTARVVWPEDLPTEPTETST